MNPVSEACNGTNLSASGLVRTGPGRLLGVWVSSTTSGTLKIWDNTSAAGTVIANTFTPTAPGFYAIPVAFVNGLYVTAANTIDFTVVWSGD